MKRSEIHLAYKRDSHLFPDQCWNPPNKRRRYITGFGLVKSCRYWPNLANPANAQQSRKKLMFANRVKRTPRHGKATVCDIFRKELLKMSLLPWQPKNERAPTNFIVRTPVKVANAVWVSGRPLVIEACSRVSYAPGVSHGIAPELGKGIIGDVSTAYDDVCGYLPIDAPVGRFPGIGDDEPGRAAS